MALNILGDSLIHDKINEKLDDFIVLSASWLLIFGC